MTKYSPLPERWVVAACLLLLLLVLPAAALPPAASTSADHTLATPLVRGSAEGHAVGVASPTLAVTAKPTPVPANTARMVIIPARQNRTTLIQELEKTAAERPKVVVPAWWFIAVVAALFMVLGAILFLLLRRGAGSPVMPKRTPAGPDRATVIGAPPVMAAGVPPEVPGPAVSFPPSLERRFMNPEFIGEGGLARVFRAVNARTGATVAVKIPVRFDEVTGTHFTRDIAFWQGLEHENIIRIYSSNILPVPYIEMEYAPSSLAAIPLPLTEEKAIGMVLGVARGLAYAHGKGIVHRDIKPENILVAADGTPKITDWGLGKAIGDTRQSSMIGFSPSYAAPEQIAPHRHGRPGPATDIYQLGMLLYELLTGTVAFEAEGLHDLNTAILDEEPVLISWHGARELGLRAIIRRCLAKRPEDRYTSVDALVRDLEAAR